MRVQWEQWRAEEEAYGAEHRPDELADVVVPGVDDPRPRLEGGPTGS